jgi:hypothetical protein
MTGYYHEPVVQRNLLYVVKVLEPVVLHLSTAYKLFVL